jgi:SAM-dependent methyltransferase
MRTTPAPASHWPAYGPDAISAQAAFNRPAYHHDLVAEWLPAIPDLASRLADTRVPARIADLGCGAGWATIALAKAYPHLHLDGYDIDEASIAMAWRNAVDQVRFEVRDLTEPLTDGPGWDAVLMLECLHDMGFPVRALHHARGHLTESGTIIVMDEAVDDELIAPTEDPVQRFFANISPLWCLPQGRTAPDAEPVGTVMRSSHLRALATAAGFSQTEILPIEHSFYRFYRLHQ